MVVAPAGTTATWLNAGLTTSPSGCKRAISMGSTVALSPDRSDPLRSSGAPPRCSDAMPPKPAFYPDSVTDVSFPQWSVEAVLASRPLVRVNQVGYLPGRPNQATLVTHRKHPLPFSIRGPGGASLWSGRSTPWPTRPEPTSGLAVHVLDFTTAGVHGRDVRVEVDGHRSHPFAVRTDAYGGLARDALGVFRLLRSGAPLRDDVPAGYARPAGHPPNRGDTAVTAWTGPDAERLYPDWRCPGTFDVSGGWYDAGDYGKYVTSGSIAVWQVLSTLDLLTPRPIAWSTDLAKTVARSAAGSLTGCCGCKSLPVLRWPAWPSTACTARS